MENTPVEMSCTHSDNVLAPTPTFAARAVVGSRDQDGQGSSIQFFGNGSSKVIVAWSTFPSLYTNGISYVISTNNGNTWSPPQDLGPYFFTMDQVLGNDRINSWPTVAVDRSHGPHRNSIYIVYSDNDSRDGADVMMQRSWAPRSLPLWPSIVCRVAIGHNGSRLSLSIKQPDALMFFTTTRAWQGAVILLTSATPIARTEGHIGFVRTRCHANSKRAGK